MIASGFTTLIASLVVMTPEQGYKTKTLETLVSD